MKTSPELARLEAELKRANEEIWSLEDEVRDHERRKDFGTSFISVARSIYRANDERAMLKRHINNLMGSDIIEEKSYSAY
jgi:chromosome segregation ATPase